MNLEEMITVAISEFLDIEIHPDTSDLDFSSKIEIVKKRMADKARQDPELYGFGKVRNGAKYEVFFKSRANDKIRIDGWVPVDTSIIQEVDRIEEYIEKGIIRKIK